MQLKHQQTITVCERCEVESATVRHRLRSEMGRRSMHTFRPPRPLVRSLTRKTSAPSPTWRTGGLGELLPRCPAESAFGIVDCPEKRLEHRQRPRRDDPICPVLLGPAAQAADCRTEDQRLTRIVPAISHCRSMSVRAIFSMSLTFVRCRRATRIAEPTRDATT